ncbi:putative aminohydrolase SsnA [Affinibrenneria salicis]|uniref:Putative aminohydrolase SsnA n=1 Tax=Affinibrenneria salicis TaxID=2590031 RepID=A0A5J5G814_9GAMM|nr:putative aminohydrolase SsnA [Affinibrenneria salicis]KAA9002805.1 putative aminohydrolase SsnA [Affinibrenneria salicis]KAA9002908.1 putative aminohydrolase SsnA [Affinibrenneria salicis]
MLILHNATLVQFAPAHIISGMDIAIDGTTIADVGTNLTARYPGATVKAMRGRLVMPGLVCAHNHFYSGLARGIMAGIAPCPDFISTLKNLWWKLDRALDEESLYYSGLICSLEAIKQGCTAVIDHHASPALIAGSLDILRRGFLQAGLRGMTCYETTDRNGGLDELRQGVEENIRFARRIEADRQAGRGPYLVEAHIGAHAPFTLPQAGLEMLADALRETGRGLHIHVAEDRYDVSHSHHHYGVDPMVRLDQAGLLNDKSLIAHGIFLSSDDVAVINQRRAFLVHNARSNMNNQVGYNARLAEYRHVALGTDGIGADMFEELKFAFFKQRDAGGSLWPDSFLRFLHNGNLLLERNFNARFGSLAAGYQADLTICDYQSPTPMCQDNLAGHLAFGLSSASVHSVMVAGNMVYEDRQFPFDVAEIYHNARRSAASLWQRMDRLP